MVSENTGKRQRISSITNLSLSFIKAAAPMLSLAVVFTPGFYLWLANNLLASMVSASSHQPANGIGSEISPSFLASLFCSPI